MTPSLVALYTGFICGVAILVDSAELLVSRRELDRDGLYSWRVLRVGRRYLSRGPFAGVLGTLFRYPTVLVLPGVQILAALALIVAPAIGDADRLLVVGFAASAAVVARTLLYMRQQVGLDGSDQMLGIVLATCAAAALLGDTAAGVAAASYAGLQLLLSYWVAGIAKVASGEWRSGRAIVGISDTADYGHAHLHRITAARPNLARLMCWSVILFECLGPFLVLAGRDGATTLLVVGIGFHVGIAIFMRLNNFLWAFAAAYPSVFLVSELAHRTLWK